MNNMSSSNHLSATSEGTSNFSEVERASFLSALQQFSMDSSAIGEVLNSLGPGRSGETAAIAREELKRILAQREEIEDVLGLESGTPWTMEEEKRFETGLYIYDGSCHDRFGFISQLMSGTRSPEECKQRFMKLILDVCQIEKGSKNLKVAYVVPMNYPQPSHQQGIAPSQATWMS